MWKAPVSALCLSALPLIGCAGEYTAHQTATVAPAPAAEPAPYYDYTATAPRVYATGPSAPAAVLVFLPGADLVASDPALWAAQGFDVVMPRPADLYRLVADQQAAMARLIASAATLANLPLWLVGPSQVIEAAMPAAGGRVSGVVVTSASSPIYSCSESFSYYNPGNGAPPQVKVTRSGDCGPGPGVSATTGRQPSILQPPQAPRPNHPRIIEASAAGKNLPPAKQVRHLAELIKAAPPG